MTVILNLEHVTGKLLKAITTGLLHQGETKTRQTGPQIDHTTYTRK